MVAVGENARYRRHYDRLLDQWIEQLVMREEPIMLTEAELDLEHHPARDFHPSRRVNVWIRYPSQAYLVQAHATAWTATAIRIWFFEPKIRIHREGWVWRSSVTPADPDENQPAAGWG
ncbi:hypothetical protein SAMN04488693_1417 [Arthrobacter subterraneus]|uniref:Uncharacterized protein n=1 Tax=Arthrobacter subterraneus TaxID=335973 RepID=A0A1G8Q353_9MICC|nr:hypothetical protein SAMN04488693_1417 [Arthrobacter subterraneus]